MAGKFFKLTISLLSLLMSTASLASEKAFELKMELSIKGKHVSSPRVIAKEGETTLITEEDEGKKTFIEVVATEDKIVRGKHSVLLKLVVGSIEQDGQKKIIYKPQILTLQNHKTELHGARDIGLSVTASQINL